MWKKMGACCGLLTVPALWAACAGETFVDPTIKLPCDTTVDCPHDLPTPDGTDGTRCIGGYCRCPNPGEDLCCKPGAAADECERICRPIGDCKAPLCRTVEDCSGPVDPRCGEAQCVDGVCAPARREKIEHQLSGDCKVIRCDAMGSTFVEADEGDVFNDGNECTVDTCKGQANVHASRAAGVAEESSGRCDGNGHLVECTSDNDCGNPLSIRCSRRGSCVPQWCTDGDFDSAFGETAVDCGGPCDPCAGGQGCTTDDDCQDRLCKEGKCALATCGDGVLNGAETDVDCGAPSCLGCEDGKACNAHESCKSGVCLDGICMKENCFDGAMNGNESGIDCGGDCFPCPLVSIKSEDGSEAAP